MSKLIRSDAEKAIFEIESYAVVDSELIQDLKNNYSQEQIIFIPKKYNFNDLEIMRENISNTIFVQLGFTCNTNNIKSFNVIPDSNFFIANILDDELLDLSLKTYKKYFDSIWREYLGDKLSELNLKMIPEVTKKESSIVIYQNETKKAVGMITTYPSAHCLGENLQQIAWVWVYSELNQNDRIKVHSFINKWMRTQEYSQYQAGIHLFNIRSQKFFHKLGFKAKCAHCILK